MFNFENKTRMTDVNKNNFRGLIFSVIGGVIVGIVMFLISSFSTDKVDIKKDIIRLDKQKADIEYVERCISEVEYRANKNTDDLNKKVDDLNKKTDRILELLIERR